MGPYETALIDSHEKRKEEARKRIEECAALRYVPFGLDSIWYKDKEGNAISAERVGKLLCDPDYKRIGLDEFNGYTISTVWLGISHMWTNGLGYFYETMVFDSDGESIETKRYGTVLEAQLGHREILNKYKRAIDA